MGNDWGGSHQDVLLSIDKSANTRKLQLNRRFKGLAEAIVEIRLLLVVLKNGCKRINHELVFGQVFTCQR